MKNIFENTKSIWVKYSDYEMKKADNGVVYITPTSNATPIMYKPFDVYEQLVVGAINIGKMLIAREDEKKIDTAIMKFVKDFGLLGIMTAIPTTPSFMDYEAVYLTKNPFVEDESMNTFSYLGYFFVALSIPNLSTLWYVYAVIFVFTHLSKALSFNPLFLLFGYQFYFVTSEDGAKIFLITKQNMKNIQDVDLSKLRRINDFTFIDVR